MDRGAWQADVHSVAKSQIWQPRHNTRVIDLLPCKAIHWLLSPSPGEGSGTPLQYSCLENPMDGGTWWAAVHGVAKSQTRLSDFTFPFHFHALEKEMATHSSILAWRIPGTVEPGGLPSMGWHRVGHDWSDLTATAAASPSPVMFSAFTCKRVDLALFLRWQEPTSLKVYHKYIKLWNLTRHTLPKCIHFWNS